MKKTMEHIERPTWVVGDPHEVGPILSHTVEVGSERKVRVFTLRCRCGWELDGVDPDAVRWFAGRHLTSRCPTCGRAVLAYDAAE